MGIDPTGSSKPNTDSEYDWLQFSGWFKLGRSPRHHPDCEALCPFCGSTVRGWFWSVSGGGKKCGCGAILYSSGHAKRLKRKPKG